MAPKTAKSASAAAGAKAPSLPPGFAALVACNCIAIIRRGLPAAAGDEAARGSFSLIIRPRDPYRPPPREEEDSTDDDDDAVGDAVTGRAAFVRLASERTARSQFTRLGGAADGEKVAFAIVGGLHSSKQWRVTIRDGASGTPLVTDAIVDLLPGLFASGAGGGKFQASELTMRHLAIFSQLGPAALNAHMHVAPAPMCLMMGELQRVPPALVAATFANGHFIFPTDIQGAPFLYFPNPVEKYCITAIGDHHPNGDGASAAVNGDNSASVAAEWLGSKSSSMRKKLNQALRHVRFAVDEDFEGTLRRMAAYHTERHESTWLSPEYIQCLVQWKTSGGASAAAFAAARVTLHTVELYDARTSELVDGKPKPLAAVFGYAAGGAFHDCSMATFERTSSSKQAYGHLVTRLLGMTLARAQAKLWYWGVELAYMSDYRRIGAASYPRPEFSERWAQAVAADFAMPLQVAAANVMTSLSGQ